MTITLTTTAAQDAILARLLTKTNADLVAQGQAALVDVPALVTYILTNAVQSYRKEQIMEDLGAVGDVFINGTNAQRTAIKTTAGVP